MFFVEYEKYRMCKDNSTYHIDDAVLFYKHCAYADSNVPQHEQYFEFSVIFQYFSKLIVDYHGCRHVDAWAHVIRRVYLVNAFDYPRTNIISSNICYSDV